MAKPIYIGFAILEMSKFLRYETYYDKLQLYNGQENIQLHYMDCDNFVLRIRTQNKIIDLKNREHFSDVSNSNENHELVSDKNEKNCG